MNHLDGYSFLPYFKGRPTPRRATSSSTFSDSGDLYAVRYDDWKISFKAVVGNLFNGPERSTNAAPVTNLRMDPGERNQSESVLYGRWWGENM
ncbi:hypothetical protein [Bythopirellula polymerisocia]|nr:hypothetical protein [Bythopirellula polymerisocia]